MKWFYNLRIGRKILLGYFIVAAIAGGIGVMGLAGIQKISEQDVYLYQKMAKPLGELVYIVDAFQNISVTIEDLIWAATPEEIDNLEIEISRSNAKFDSNLKTFETTLKSPEAIQIADETYLLKDDYDKKVEEIITLTRAGKPTEAAAIVDGEEFETIRNKIEDHYRQMMEIKIEIVKDTAASNVAIAETSTMITVILLILGLVLSLLLSLFITGSITRPVIKIKTMIKEMSMGHLGMRLHMSVTDEIGEMATAMDNFADDLQNTVIQTMHQISAGNVAINIEPVDEMDEITPALIQTIQTVRALIDESVMLSEAAVAGRLEIRGNEENFSGGFKEILVGFNHTLDALVTPLNVAADCVNQIGKGIIPNKINYPYQGDFKTFKTSINACIDGLGALQEGNEVLGLMNQNDFTQAVKGNYLGIYAEIAASINGIRRLLLSITKIAGHIRNGDLSDLEGLKQNGKRSQNDYLIPTLVEMMENIYMLVGETEMMAQIAVEGDLSHRGDSSKFSGEYALMIDGFNQTLDAVIEPIKEASMVLQELAQGNLQIMVRGEYNGDHAKIKKDLNQTIISLEGYVRKITETLEAMGQGKLNQEITSEFRGDFSNIKKSLNDINMRLSTTLSDINTVSTQVENGAIQISDTGQALAQATTEQASSIEELTASIEEVADDTKYNAKRSKEANEMVIAVSKNVEVGNAKMQQMITAMVEINESANNISKIIKVIDDIAFQTNVLALNAAVEAARAGQHGKGFAVVAQEVRHLSELSSNAVRETAELIEKSFDKVEAGTKAADDTGESLKAISSEIEKVSDLLAAIAQASKDQANEIEQINQGIEQVSRVVQNNSATAEQSAAASEELSGQSQILKQMVSAFEIREL
ncbi:methyl-accepting chemotaxis protein [Acetobacterium woodii]|uniref:Methyl-accepting chemotaxis transducer protein n=1 Tax=Acetobacterium woodii (strain ATCC 29683 / DSM 1030 / JCM 2381 / KCTC 1655 / WB1) TaxID=931626 RepID=H6LCS7_ACEWD|nr:methyl-accepting chemotaxis protein [Acetobacterium woodii]AFA49064.1 methyl-accepting chemotaxis transducer protein [Acetobacterium woodii DSM 1030]